MRLWVLSALVLSACAAASEPQIECRHRCLQLKADAYVATWEIHETPSCSCIFNLPKGSVKKGGTPP